MSDDADPFASDSNLHRERPVLFPWNRRLRHLQGISVRNVNITPPLTRLRGKTITDDDVPYNLKSSAKRLAQSESKALHHSRSFADLKSPSKQSHIDSGQGQEDHGKGKISRRPGGGLRRRSTLHSTGASPEMREIKLQKVAANRLADTWFSIHRSNISGPVYVSEVMERTMNPSFRFFDLGSSGPNVSRNSDFSLKLWARNNVADQFMLLSELELNLQSLQFIGHSLENFRHPLPENCIIFHLTDGLYTSFTDMPPTEAGRIVGHPGAARSGHVDVTSSYDALMRLAVLDDCIQDALRTRSDIEVQINNILQATSKARTLRASVESQETANSVDHALSAQKRSLRQALKRREDMKQSLLTRQEAITSGREAQLERQPRLDNARDAVLKIESGMKLKIEESCGQIRRICEDLSLIYPLEPVKNKALHFSIRGIYLPNSAYNDTNGDEIAAALGFTSHLVYLLSLYVSTPLPYPLLPTAPIPTVKDPVSAAIAKRSYALHPNESFKFEYAVLLLNKDIEFLMSKSSLRMLDIRHTLPNLKYLLYVLTAGKGQLPARKAGGVRGLLIGRGTPSISRRGSNESVTSDIGWAAPDGRQKEATSLGQRQVGAKLERDLDPFFSSAGTALPL